MKVLKTSAVLKALLDDGWFIVQVTINGKPSDDIWGAKLKSVEQQSGLEF